MAYLRHYDDWRRGYIDVCKSVVEKGAVVGSRAGVTMEIRDFIFDLHADSIDLPLGTGRRVATQLAAAEAIQLCCGVGMPALTEAASSQVASFIRDPDGTVHGNYGQRVGLQILDVIEKLQADPHSRQAVIQIWDKGFDSRYRSPMPKDIPCTLTIVLGLTPGRTLQMSVTMRSNDVWLGLPFDVFQFRQLQRTIANIMDVSVAKYTHHAVSMHAYDHDLAKIAGLELDEKYYQRSELPMGIHVQHAAELTQTFIRILSGSDKSGERSHDWYHLVLGGAYKQALGAR